MFYNIIFHPIQPTDTIKEKLLDKCRSCTKCQSSSFFEDWPRKRCNQKHHNITRTCTCPLSSNRGKVTTDYAWEMWHYETFVTLNYSKESVKTSNQTWIHRLIITVSIYNKRRVLVHFFFNYHQLCADKSLNKKSEGIKERGKVCHYKEDKHVEDTRGLIQKADSWHLARKGVTITCVQQLSVSNACSHDSMQATVCVDDI